MNQPAITEPADDKMIVAVSTEISTDADTKVRAAMAKLDRSRSYVLRMVIHEWAAKQPKPVKK